MGTQHEKSAVLEREVTLTEPPLYKVILLNDDYTPMEFVVIVLQEFFLMDRASATQTMLKVHNEGKGTCGIFSKDVARTKVELVLDYAQRQGHPLRCVMEEV
jgi:ATP-dependent Clp protease adaptor protein ClpS